MRLPFAILLFLVPVAAGAGDARVDRVEIVSQGTYRVEVGEATADPDAPTG
jgi:hypothetical protein